MGGDAAVERELLELGVDLGEAHRVWRKWDRELLDELGLDLGAEMTRPPEYLTKQEAAAYARVSVSTIERAIRGGDLQAGGTPGRVLIRREWIDEWIEHRRVPERMRGQAG